MIKITILSVGKIKKPYLKQGIKEFSKRLSRYCKLEHITVNDEHAPESLSASELEDSITKEGERILKRIKPTSYVIVLTLDGKTYTSEAFAHKLNQLPVYTSSHITFVIGGSNGLSKEVIKQSNEQLSFSKMTFPHQLMKLILLEQLYRSFRINNNEPYHK